jgi:hypothetical protein
MAFIAGLRRVKARSIAVTFKYKSCTYLPSKIIKQKSFLLKLSPPGSHFQVPVFIVDIGKRVRKHTHFIPLKNPLYICGIPVLILNYSRSTIPLKNDSRPGGYDVGVP